MAKTTTSRIAVELDVDGDERVPAILQLPAAREPVPGVVLLHGFSSRKERVADSMGQALLQEGIASIAIDLPWHGERSGGVESLLLRNPLTLVKKWKLAVREANSAIDYLASHPAIDARRLAIGGYSLGSYLAMSVAGDNMLVRAVALAAGGDLPKKLPFASLVRTVADPRRAARALAGRPLFMVNGRHDDSVTPAQARALFDAAGEPKAIRWYDGGHWPPAQAIQAAAVWLSEQLGASEGQSRLA